MFGLSVNYELYDEAALLARTEQKTSSEFMKTGTDLSSLLPPSRYDNAPVMDQRKKSRHVESDSKDLKLKELDFANCMINKISVRKFVMKNNSGIRAPFILRSQNFEPVQYLDQVIPQTAAQQADGSRHTPSSSKISGPEMTERCIDIFDI